MGVVGFRLRQRLRSDWRSVAALTLVVAAVSAIVFAVAAGAQRSSTAPDRYVADRGVVFDATVTQQHGPPRTAELAALPGVRGVESITFLFGGLLPSDAAAAGGTSAPREVSTIVFAGRAAAIGAELVDGREPDPTSRTEFVANESFLTANDAAIGDRFAFGTYTQAHADIAGMGADAPDTVVEGVELVGVVHATADGDPSRLQEPVIVFPVAVLDDGNIGVALTIMGVQLRPGVDLELLRAQLDSLSDHEVFAVEPAVLVDPGVRTAVRTQSRGLWLLAAVAAAASIAALGQVVTRSVRLSTGDRTGLSAIGVTSWQMVAESMGRAAIPVVGGTLAGVGLATLASGAFPTGFVRRIEPHRGMRFEAFVLLGGAAVFLLAVLTWTFVAVASPRAATTMRAPRATDLVERLAKMSPSAAAATGLRFAFRRAPGDVGSVRTAIAGLLLVGAGVFGALTFGSSLDRLVSDPARYGANYDGFFDNGAASISDEIREGLEADPDVGALLLYAQAQSRIGPDTLQLVGMEPVRGDVFPEVLIGRLPAASDEIALGRVSARDLGVGVGDTISLDGADHSERYRVTGLAVVPSIGGNDGVGHDGLLTMSGLQRLDPDAVAAMAVFDLRDDAPDGALARIMGGFGLTEEDDTDGEPIQIENLDRVRPIPYLLVLLLGALAALTIAQATIASVHNRRRDLAVLRSLGADRRWVTRAVHWQATLFALSPVTLGAPVGLFAGLLTFRALADSIGVVDSPSLPWWWIVAAIAGIGVLANVVAAVPARRARRLSPALLLHPE